MSMKRRNALGAAASLPPSFAMASFKRAEQVANGKQKLAKLRAKRASALKAVAAASACASPALQAFTGLPHTTVAFGGASCVHCG